VKGGDRVEDMKKLLRESEFSQHRLGLLIQTRVKFADELKIPLIPLQREKLRVQYAELFGEIDEVIVTEARALCSLYDNTADIQASEAKCLTALLRALSRES